MRPFLDIMQTILAFVYLVPVVMLIGIGNVSGVIVTIIFALPPLIRLTSFYEAGVKNIGDLKDPKIAARFDTDNDGKAELAGCIPGWGCERNIEHHLTKYKLRDTIEHNQGTYAVMMVDTITRHKTGKPILYFTKSTPNTQAKNWDLPSSPTKPSLKKSSG